MDDGATEFQDVGELEPRETADDDPAAELLAEYRAADDNRRIEMYRLHRESRDRFDAVELEESLYLLQVPFLGFPH